MERRRLTIGGALDECISESTEEWFRQHSGHRSREEAAANDIQQVSGTIERLSGGRLRVWVGIVGRTREQCMTDWYPYQLQDKHGYVRTEPSKATG